MVTVRQTSKGSKAADSSILEVMRMMNTKLQVGQPRGKVGSLIVPELVIIVILIAASNWRKKKSI